ncbi:hypothetical protein ABT299_05760 [Spirillospora sp. NPDC000708]
MAPNSAVAWLGDRRIGRPAMGRPGLITAVKSCAAPPQPPALAPAVHYLKAGEAAMRPGEGARGLPATWSIVRRDRPAVRASTSTSAVGSSGRVTARPSSFRAARACGSLGLGRAFECLRAFLGDASTFGGGAELLAHRRSSASAAAVSRTCTATLSSPRVSSRSRAASRAASAARGVRVVFGGLQRLAQPRVLLLGDGHLGGDATAAPTHPYRSDVTASSPVHALADDGQGHHPGVCGALLPESGRNPIIVGARAVSLGFGGAFQSLRATFLGGAGAFGGGVGARVLQHAP